MMATGNVYASLLAVGFAVLSTSPTRLSAQQDTVGIGNSDLGGVATSATGVEAGVRVIAETTDLPAKMAKIVVSDDRGRYLIPDLPQTNYTSGFVDTGWSTPPKSNPRLEMPDLGASAFLATAWEPPSHLPRPMIAK